MDSRGISPIFIVGSSRSGTTMMNRVLGGNPEVAAYNELHYLGGIWDTRRPLAALAPPVAVNLAARLLSRIRKGIWGGPPGHKETSDAERLIGCREHWTHKDIYASVLEHEAADNVVYVTDQTPRNTLFMDEILTLFPTARVIHMIRDPRAVMASQRNRWKIKWLGAETMPWRNTFRVWANYHPFTLTWLWIRAAKVAKAYAGCKRYKVVRFENVLKNPEESVRDVCEFLELDFLPSMLDVPQVGSSNKMHDQTKRGIADDVSEAWKQTLPKGDIFLCERMAIRYLREYDYVPISKLGWSWRLIFPVCRFPFHIIGSVLLNAGIVYLHVKTMVSDRWSRN